MISIKEMVDLLFKNLNEKKWSWILFIMVNIIVPLLIFSGISIANCTSQDDIGIIWLISFFLIVIPLLFMLELMITNKLRYYVPADLIVISVFTAGCIQIRDMGSIVGKENMFNIVVLMSAGIMMVIAVSIIMVVEIIISLVIRYRNKANSANVVEELGKDSE